METEAIISIITVCVTLILGIAGFIINSFVQRKSNSIKIITQTRLDRRAHSQKRVAELLKLSDPLYILSLSTPEESTRVIREAAEIAADLRSIYCFNIDADVNLIKAVYKVKDILCKSVLGEIGLEHQMMTARGELARNIDVYSSTEWKRIKLETVGKETHGKKSIESWYSIYKYYNSNFQNECNEYIFRQILEDDTVS